MIRIEPFELQRPRTILEALHALRKTNESLFMAGGTDLMPKIKRRQFEPRSLVSLANVEEMTGIQFKDDRVEIGALTRLRVLEEFDFAGNLVAFVQAIKTVATPVLRNTATIGGNLLQDTRCRYYDRSFFWRDAIGYCLKKDGDVCLVAPGGNHCFATLCSDIAPALVVLDAQVVLVGLDSGERTIPLGDLYHNDGMSHLNMEREILTRVTIPKNPLLSVYKKLRLRKSFDFPELGLAMSMKEADGRCAIHVAACGVSSDIFTIRETIDRTDVPAFVDRVCGAIKPMDTLCTPPSYRKRVARNFLQQSINELIPS